MIIDSHAYCFEPANAPAGYGSTAEHLQWVQVAQAHHHQPAIRLKDRAYGASDILDSDFAWDLSRLPDVNFRIEQAEGRVLWDHADETYTKYFYPPNLRNLEYTPMSLISEMDYAGVDMAFLHTNPMMGHGQGYAMYLRDCLQQYPDRLRSMVQVDEHRIVSETDQVIKALDLAINTYGLHAVKFNATLAYLSGPTPWDDGPYRPFWKAVEALGIPVFFTINAGPSAFEKNASIHDDIDSYLGEVQVLMRWMERYPQSVCSVTHGFPYRLFLDEGRLALPEAVWQPFEYPNCHMEVCFPVRLGDLFDYPYREVWPTLQTMVERIGANRLLWGTDMPFQNRFCTYRQSRQWIETYCDFLSEEDLKWIMGGTIARILRMDG